MNIPVEVQHSTRNIYVQCGMKYLVILLIIPSILFAQTKTILPVNKGGVNTSEKRVLKTSDGQTVIGTYLSKITLGKGYIYPFSFNISTTKRTSAGVFALDSTLVRTLWSGVTYPAGTHTLYWDGKNDTGVNVPSGNYQIKVMSNNVTYNWDGIVGNTSAASTGSSVFESSELAVDILIVGDYGYVCSGFSEGKPSQTKFLLSNPTSKIPIGNLPTTAQSTEVMCSDGVNVYYGGIDAYFGAYNFITPTGAYYSGNNPPTGSKYIIKSFVFATKVSDETQVVFSAGVNPMAVTISNPDHYESGIDVDTTTRVGYLAVTGLAVQQNGINLFIARTDNTIHVVNKTSGALRQIISISSPRKMYADNNYLWLIYGNNQSNLISRFTINSDGSLISDPLTLTGTTLSNPLAVTLTPDGKLAITDGGLSCQVKFFNKTTGEYISSFGQSGGYNNTPVVSNDRFSFTDSKLIDNPPKQIGSIAYAPDGSFLINDRGNVRVQHFAANGTYINNVMSIGFNYAVSVDSNDPTRVFSNYLEFAIDYSKPLSPSNGSWTLVKNWTQKVRQDFGMSTVIRLKDVTTLSNGRTYALQPSGSKLELVELSDTGMRYTGFIPVFTGQSYEGQYSLEPDGSLIAQDTDGSTFYYVRRALTGFVNNIPTYATNAPHEGDLFVQLQGAVATDPISMSKIKSRQTTSTGVRVTFKPERSGGYHLGGIVNNKWLWKTSASTHREYMGNFPAEGTFDIGNTVEHAGGAMQTAGRNIFYNYVGEFWGAYSTPRAGQTNKWNHYYDDGLFIGQFGVVAHETSGEAEVGMAGNSYGSAIAQVGETVYVYHGDESHHSGVHRWKITGLNTIHEQIIPVVVPVIQVQPALTYINLMAGLPFNSTLTNSTYSGWTLTGFNSNKVNTSIRTYNKKNGDDITANADAGNASITRNLGSNISLTSWTVEGVLQLVGLPNYIGGGDYGAGVFIEVLDNADKVIARFNWQTNYGTAEFVGNGLTIASDGVAAIQYKAQHEQPLSITLNAGTVILNYADYGALITTTLADPSANWANPTKLRVNFKTHQQGQNVNVKEFKFKFN